MQSYLLVAVGGAVGAALRYGLSQAVASQGAGAWPWATLLANVSGGLLIGFLAAFVGIRGHGAESVRLLLGVGLLGGFTTFSAFSLETVHMIEKGRMPLAVAYVLGSVVLTLTATVVGLWLGRKVFA